MAVLLSLAALVMTLAGGLLALRVRDHRHLVLGLAGGLILGVVAFDLIPEALRITGARLLHVPVPMIGFAAGFALLHVVEQAAAIHRAHEREYAPHTHAHGRSGPLAAAALVGHSLVDGLSIGLGFQAGASSGLVVALAVIVHDLADGFNTVTVASLHRTDRRPAILLLLADALAPVAGTLIALSVPVPHALLGPYLGFFAGVLLYLAAAEILPEAHSGHPRVLTLCTTGLGVLLVLGVVGAA
ncbi:ZIP family metal transporter [Actinomadura parmotrematis]|uniref:ZIP family metal transporter n=1 Tax=Actinomadura parmotrematis TaxID=2864039 RepID=A0ABS7FNX3_9ACTN|nr:ZIP family metal transporter [Actinomadura parmotrematis]MBW8482006.1 ZIP family metal transporter [Actinomadura parmotrematis]